ncbi:LmbU family transcriptional regulator [Nocardia sp. NPDC051321]|uniref:LmbU family transcriptional regulator n=1 Tax=Nocardia sp. NPDC051321 TaxID=3364323 RepID=UPI00379A2C2B
MQNYMQEISTPAVRKNGREPDSLAQRGIDGEVEGVVRNVNANGSERMIRAERTVHDVYRKRNSLILPKELSFEAWSKLGTEIIVSADASAWWIGDWLFYGEKSYGERYRNAIDATMLDYQTLRNYAWIAKKYPVSRRRDKLSFGHHVEVAALTDDEQDLWLDRALRFCWSRNELRRRVRAARLANNSETKPVTKVLRIDAEADCYERWNTAAEIGDRCLNEWAAEALDAAAAAVLNEPKSDS